MHELSKNRMVPKISNFHYLGLKELKCAVICYFQGFYRVVWQFGTSAFHMVVLWNKLSDVENECTSHNFSLKVKSHQIWWKFDKFLTNTNLLSFLRHGVLSFIYPLHKPIFSILRLSVPELWMTQSDHISVTGGRSSTSVNGDIAIQWEWSNFDHS